LIKLGLNQTSIELEIPVETELIISDALKKYKIINDDYLCLDKICNMNSKIDFGGLAEYYEKFQIEEQPELIKQQEEDPKEIAQEEEQRHEESISEDEISNTL
jgi:hypothetical protein